MIYRPNVTEYRRYDPLWNPNSLNKSKINPVGNATEAVDFRVRTLRNPNVGGQFQCPLGSVYQMDLYHGAAGCTFDIGINIHTPTDVESEIMNGNGDEPCCKITRVARAHHIRDADTKLLQQREQGASLRELAIFFNKQVLSNALDRATQEVIGDAETIYEVLMDEDTDRAREAELRSKLARYNVDIDDVQRDFISHQTVRNHLNGCREIDTERESTLTLEGGQKTIEWAQARSEGVIEQTIERLRNAGEVADTQTEVTQSVRVACSACGQSYRIDAFLEQGGCSCQPDSD